MGFEDTAREEGCRIFVLEHPPDVHVAFVVASGKEGAVTRDGDRGHRHILRGNQLVSTFRLAKVPDANIPTTVGRDEFTLIWVDDNIVHWVRMRVVPLNNTRASVPHFNSHIFGGRNHPFPFTVKGHTSDIIRVTFKRHNRIRISRFDIVKLDIVPASGSKILLVRRNTKSVDLRFRMLDCARTNPRKRFPEPDGVVVTSFLVCQG